MIAKSDAALQICAQSDHKLVYRWQFSIIVYIFLCEKVIFRANILLKAF
jgi:hypothetical protein